MRSVRSPMDDDDDDDSFYLLSVECAARVTKLLQSVMNALSKSNADKKE